MEREGERKREKEGEREVEREERREGGRKGERDVSNFTSQPQILLTCNNRCIKCTSRHVLNLSRLFLHNTQLGSPENINKNIVHGKKVCLEANGGQLQSNDSKSASVLYTCCYYIPDAVFWAEKYTCFSIS